MSENNIPNESAFKNAFKEAKKTKLWCGTIEEREQKFIALHDKLNAIYGKNIPLYFENVNERYEHVQGASGASGYNPRLVPPEPLQALGLPVIEERMVIRCKMSVITFMQLWLRALGIDQISAVEISAELFREVFPVSARNIVMINGLQVKTTDANNDPNNDPLTDGSGADNNRSD